MKCLYVLEEQEAILKGALEKILLAFEKGQDNLSKGAIGQEYYSYLSRFTGQLLKEISIEPQSIYTFQLQGSATGFMTYKIKNAKILKSGNIIIL